MYCVYILKCSDNSYYTGLTENIKRRLKEHELGQSLFTKNRRPVQLVFCCYFPSKHQAALFEKYLKSHSGVAFRNKHLLQSLPGEAEGEDRPW